MADPASITILGVGLPTIMGGLSTAFTVFDAISTASAEKQAVEYNTRQAAEQSAQIAVEKDQELKQQRRDYALFAGEQRAKAGATGNMASSFDLLADSASQNALDLLTIERNAAYRQQAVRSEDEAQRMRAGNIGLKAGTRILGKLTSNYISSRK